MHGSHGIVTVFTQWGEGSKSSFALPGRGLGRRPQRVQRLDLNDKGLKLGFGFEQGGIGHAVGVCHCVVDGFALALG